MPEERLRAELVQPGFFEARTQGRLRAEVNHYAVLLTPDYVQGAPVLGYRELVGSAGVSRQFGPVNVSAPAPDFTSATFEVPIPESAITELIVIVFCAL